MKPKKKNKAIGRSSLRSFLPFYIMLLPGVVYLLINNYLPMTGMIMAFKHVNFNKGILGSPWAGFSNFEYLFKTKEAWIITRNTLGYNLVFIFINTFFGVLVAILLNEIRAKFWKKTYQTIILLPYLISMIVVSYLTFAFLSSDFGFINNTIFPLLGKAPIPWYTEKKYWPFILTFIQGWKVIGYNSILYYATLVGIDTSYYEAAVIDGANRWQQMKSITLPFLAPTIITMVLLSVGRIFYSDFGLFYQVPMDSGPLYDVTNTIDTYVYRGLIKLNDVGMASAAGVYQSIVGFIVVLLANLSVRKINEENALF